MVAFCCRFAVTPHIMRRRHLESVSAALYGQCFASFVSSRSLAARGSWGTAPSVFWYGVPGGTQGPLGKGGAAERWRVAYPIGIATRHGAKPATTRTYKSRPRRVGMLTMPLQGALPHGQQSLAQPLERPAEGHALHGGSRYHRIAGHRLALHRHGHSTYLGSGGNGGL